MVDSYINGIKDKDRKVAEIGISYAGTPDFAHEMAENLRFWVLQFQSLRLVPSFKRTLVKAPLP